MQKHHLVLSTYIFVVMETGYIHVYTGNGKGKTTAAFGLAVRALCAGKSVFIGQFVKSMKYNETRLCDLLAGCLTGDGFGKICIEQFGNGCLFDRKPVQADIDAAERGLRECAERMACGKWDVVILDELTIAIYLGLLTEDAVLMALHGRHPAVEVVITGRYASEKLIDIADLVTDMQEVKHYYTKGVLSRDGIDR